MVVIVVDPDLGPVEGNLRGLNFSSDLKKERCPHLRGDKPGEYSCAVHDRPWYPETPCFSHGQIERSPDDPCRMGDYILRKQNETEAREGVGNPA
jgi:hypothetical protein